MAALQILFIAAFVWRGLRPLPDNKLPLPCAAEIDFDETHEFGETIRATSTPFSDRSAA